MKKYIGQLLESDPEIDTIVLGCTHYPLLLPKIRQYVREDIRILPQGEIVAQSLADYLQRHPEMEEKCLKGEGVEFLTTENEDKFDSLASLFMEEEVHSHRIIL